MKRLITYFSTPNALSLVIGSTLDRLWSDIDPLKSRKFLSILALLLTIGVGNAWGATTTLAGWTFTSGTAGTNYPSNNTNFGATSGTMSTNSTFCMNGSGSTWNSGAGKGYAFTSVSSVVITLKLNQKLAAGAQITLAADVFYNKASNKPVGSYAITTKVGSAAASSTGVGTTTWTLSNSSANKTSTYTTQAEIASGTTIQFILTASGSSGSGQAYFNNVTIKSTTYTVTYNANSGTGSVPTDATAYCYKAIVTVKGNTGPVSRSGYEFGGWNTNTTGDGTNYTAGSGTFTITANTTLYAKWTAAVSTYTVYVPNTYGSCNSIGSYTSNQGSSGSGTGTWAGYTAYSGITAGTSVTITATPESGYSFAGWTDDDVSIIWDEESNEITPSSTTSNTATFTMPSANVYVMECAFSTACSASPTVGNAANNGALVYSTTPMTVPVTCPSIGAGASCSINDYGFVWASSTPTISDNKTRIGTDNHSTAFSGNISGTFAAGTTYYVKAYAINNGGNTTLSSGAYSFTPYSITFNSNGGSSVATMLVLGSTAASAPTAPTKTGYTFGGWYSNEGLTTPVDWSSTIGTNKTYYAKWTAKTTTVSFNQNSGTGGQTGTLTATYGSAMPSAPITCPTRDGYDFGGYYDGSGGTGTQYYTNTGASARNWDKENATWTLYAKWTLKSYSVTWKVNNTNYSAGGSTSVNHGSRVATLPTAPDPGDYCGHKFMGWTDATDGAYVHGTSSLFTTAGTAPVASGAQIYYAVFADYVAP